MIKGIANVALTLAFFYGCGWWLFVGHMDHLRRTEDPGYAAELFAGLAPVDEILASRKYHQKGSEPWDCTYAIARLGPDAPVIPPTRAWDNELGWQYAFGGEWKGTPALPLARNARDAFGFCEKYWSKPLAKELDKAMANAGAWYSRSGSSELVFLYAPEQRLAARVRFGD